MLKSLLAIYDDQTFYEKALAVGARARRGCRGLPYPSKVHLLDTMELLRPVWNSDNKYANTVSIQCCWRKSGLPASEEAVLKMRLVGEQCLQKPR
jgi:hypothetical protein